MKNYSFAEPMASCLFSDQKRKEKLPIKENEMKNCVLFFTIWCLKWLINSQNCDWGEKANQKLIYKIIFKDYFLQSEAPIGHKHVQLLDMLSHVLLKSNYSITCHMFTVLTVYRGWKQLLCFT